MWSEQGLEWISLQSTQVAHCVGHACSGAKAPSLRMWAQQRQQPTTQVALLIGAPTAPRRSLHRCWDRPRESGWEAPPRSSGRRSDSAHDTWERQRSHRQLLRAAEQLGRGTMGCTASTLRQSPAPPHDKGERCHMCSDPQPAAPPAHPHPLTAAARPCPRLQTMPHHRAPKCLCWTWTPRFPKWRRGTQPWQRGRTA